MRDGDVLLKWNGAEVSSPAELRKLVEKTPVGSKAKVTIWRNGQEQVLEVTVGQRPVLPVES
jgi:serine protease Do